ncbi:hypothetical protein D3C80_904030 [compost metagenome]
MGDEHHRHVALLLEPGDEFQDLRLCGHIERRCRLVGDQHFRLESQRHRDHHALTLTAGKLERIAVGRPRRIGQTDLRQHGQRFCLPLLRRQQTMRLEHFLDLRRDLHQRVERRHRLLEDHRHTPPANGIERIRRHGDQIGGAKQDTPLRHTHRIGQKSHQRICRHGFARAAFADHAEHLSGKELEADAVDRIGTIRAVRKCDAQPVDMDDGFAPSLFLQSTRMDDGGSDFVGCHGIGVDHVCHGYLPLRARRGLRASFSPSPTRLSASTVRRIARPGKKLTHQA